MCTFQLSSVNVPWGHSCPAQIWIAMLPLGVSLHVCVYIMCCSFILTNSPLFLSRSFPFLPPHPQLSLFCLLQRMNSGSSLSSWSPQDTYPLFLYCFKKKKIQPVLFVVCSVYLLCKWEKYSRACVSYLAFALLRGLPSPLTWRAS